ncbi:hypothetical protein NQZ68_033554 [Dissostichus eleginoides]|nr:hypothetical protein NQZ68_033554 [Dissostichus eleginoides]
MERENYVGRLNEYANKKGLPVDYRESPPDGPDQFTQRVVLNGIVYPEGVGKSKREAKKEAAKNALRDLSEGTHQTADDNYNPTPAQQNFIGLVNDYCMKKKCCHTFVEVRTDGQAHIRQFFYRLIIDNKEYPVAEGRTIKEARQNAARRAWPALKEQMDWDSKVSVRSTLSENGAPPSSSSSSSTPLESHEASSQSMFTSDFDPIEYLGSGGYGWVYKARRKLEEKYYAVKIVRSDKNAFREVLTLSELLHHNVIRYFNCWIEDTRYQDDISAGSYSDTQSTDDPSVQFLYIQMELCKTKTLKEWIHEKNTQSLQDTKRGQESLTIAQQIVSGVEYIHSKGHIHRDLKPENILFGLDDKEVKIGDFGLVTRDDDALMDRTENRGTRSYMAPEQVGKTYDRKVDIFALGLIYLELLWKVSSGHERGEVLKNARKQILPTNFSRAFQEENLIIKKMLHEKPEDRPEASELKAQLDKLAQTENEPQKRATV